MFCLKKKLKKIFILKRKQFPFQSENNVLLGQFLVRAGVGCVIMIYSIFEQKPSYFCFCQIFPRDSFRDINIIDTSIHPSRDKQFMKGQKYIKRAMEIGLFDISISNIDCRYIDTFEKYQY